MTFSLSKSVPSGGFLRLSFPSSMTVSKDITDCKEVDSRLTVKTCTPDVAKNFIEFTFNEAIELVGANTDSYSIKASTAVNLPDTIKVTEQIDLVTKSGELRQTTFQATQGVLTSATLTPKDLIVGGDTTLQVDITTAHKIPKKGKIVIGVTAPWNEGATDGRIDYFSSITCDGMSVAGVDISSSTYVCSFLDNSRVEVSGAFDLQECQANSVIKLNINGFRNPIQANVAVNAFNVYTSGEDYQDIIDFLSASVTASKAATLSGVQWEVSPIQTENVGIVQEVNVMRLKFSSPLPLRDNCEVSYWFPTRFYDASDITSIQTGSLFAKTAEIYYPSGDASSSGKTFTVKTEDTNFKSITFKTCETFRSNEAPEITRIIGLKQPRSTEPTTSLKVYIKDQAGNTVAQLDKGASFTPIQGNITLISAQLDPTTVWSLSSLTFVLQPDHDLYGSENPSLTIELPEDFKVQSTCLPLNPPDNDALGDKRTCQVSQIENQITINNLINGAFIGKNQLKFKIGLVELPESTAGGKGEFRYTTYIQPGTSKIRYAVDFGKSSNLFTITVGGFISASVTPSILNSYVTADYLFKIQPKNLIPKYGVVTIEYPSQISISDPSLSQTLCKNWTNFPSTTGVCQIFTSNRTLIINKGFQASQGGNAASTEYSWVVPLITNPATLAETDSFKIVTRDQYFNPIDEIKTNVTIKMTNAAYLSSEALELDSYTNAERTSYNFQIVVTTPLLETDYIHVTFPPQTKVPVNENDLNCISKTVAYVYKIQCSLYSKVPNSVQLRLFQIKPIPAFETFQFTIGNIMNPNSTYPSDALSIQIFDSPDQSNLIHRGKGNLNVITTVPYTVKKPQASLTSSNLIAGMPSTFTLKMELKHNIEKGGGLLIRYPPQVVVNDDVTVSVDAKDFNYFTLLKKPEIDYSARQILFLDESFQSELKVEEGKRQNLSIEIKGLSNPYNNEASSSFQIVTFNKINNVLYFIDQVEDGLVIDSQCDYPCNTCKPSDPTHCTSCFKDSSKKFLQESTCLEKCSEGRYYNAQLDRCEICDETCLTCEGSSKKCTSCGVGDYLLLRIDECVKTCGTGYIDDPSTNMCLKCKDGCTSCSKSTTNCTSCDAGSNTPFFFKYDCKSSCPKDIGVKQGDLCLECSASCKTCVNETTTCTSCLDYMRFDPLNKKCLEACEADTQIFLNGQCETCNEKCTTCVDNVNKCTGCKTGFVLNTDNTCKESCLNKPDQTPVNGICKQCEQPCKTCEGTEKTCKSCIDDFLLYKNTCVDHCPDKYEANNATINQCILVGLVCPEGFHVNDAGEGCVPNEFECKPGYEINQKRTACIPAPGSPIPFPFLFLAICMSLTVAGSYMKEKDQTKVYTCLIFLIGSMEILEYLLIAVYAALIEQVYASLLAFIAFIMMVGANIGFTILYWRHTVKDQQFADWIRIYKKTYYIIPILCIVFNFKIVRFLFSGFFGMDNCLASFSEPRTAIHKHMKMMTYFKYIFVYAPIFLADALIFYQVQWGHQLLVLAIETFILQILIIYFTYKEFKDPEKLYKEADVNKYKALRPRKNGQIQVMSAAIEEADGIDEDHIVRQDLNKSSCEYEIFLRKKALTAILQQVGSNFLVSQKRGVDIGGQITKVFTKYDKEKLKLRRAVSCVELNQQSQFGGTDGTKEDEDCSYSQETEEEKQRRFSFPFLEPIEEVTDPFFSSQVSKIRKAVLDEKYKDNVIGEQKKMDHELQNMHVRKKKMVNRRTQTYLRELLQLEGEELQDSDMEIIMEEEVEIDDQYTKGLINNVLDGVSEEGDQSKVDESASRSRRKRRKTKDVPPFELEDIMGEFEIDEAGNHIILRGDRGELLDRDERPVNKRGYLVDKFGNVINKNEQIIFKAAELDSDDEIPQQYGFEKRKQNLLNMTNEFQVQNFGNGPGKDDKQDFENEEDVIQKEFNMIKQGEQIPIKVSSPRSSSRSGMEEPIAGGRGFLLDENSNIDEMIGELTKKTKPVKKRDLQSPSRKRNQNKFRPPAGKSGTERMDNKMFFPKDNLQKISEQIGGFNSQVVPQIVNNQDLPGNSEVSSQTRIAVGTAQRTGADFYAQGPQSQIQAQSEFSHQDAMFMGSNFNQRPPIENKHKQINSFAAQKLQGVYGGNQERQGRKTQMSPQNLLGSRRPESSKQNRVFSGDPRLRGLESIYLNKFNKPLGSQKSLALKKSFASNPRSRKVANNTSEVHLNEIENQRSAMIAETIERLQKDYLGETEKVPVSATAVMNNRYVAQADQEESQLGQVQAQNWFEEQEEK